MTLSSTLVPPICSKALWADILTSDTGGFDVRDTSVKWPWSPELDESPSSRSTSAGRSSAVNHVNDDAGAGLVARPATRTEPAATLAATHARHLGTADSKAEPFAATDQPDSYEVKPSGNAVVLEQQLIKVTETQMDHQTMSNLYRKHLRLFQIAIGGGK